MINVKSEKNEELYLLCDDTDEQYVLEHKEEYEAQIKKFESQIAEIEARILRKYGFKPRKNYATE